MKQSADFFCAGFSRGMCRAQYARRRAPIAYGARFCHAMRHPVPVVHKNALERVRKDWESVIARRMEGKAREDAHRLRIDEGNSSRKI